MSSIEPAEVIEMLVVTPIHDLQKTLDGQGIDILTFFENRDLRRLDFSRIKQGLSLSFERSNLQQSSFRGVILHQAAFAGADLRAADFREASITGSSFQPHHSGVPVALDGARFDNARLSRVDFVKVALHRSVLVGARISGGALEEVDLAFTNLNGIALAPGSARNCDLTGVTGTDVELGGTSIWTECKIDNAYLPGARLGGAVLIACRGTVGLPGAVLESSELQACDLPNADLSRAALRDSWIHECNLAGARLVDADLSKAQIEGTDLRTADLTGADLAGASLADVDLRGAVINQQQLQSAAKVERVLTD